MCDRAARFNEREILPQIAQLKICVQWPAGIGAILTGSKNHQIATRRKICRRKSPAGQITCVIRQMPSTEIYRARTSIVNLDPAGTLQIFVLQTAAVAGEKFIDDHSPPSRGDKAEKTQQQRKTFEKSSIEDASYHSFKK
jgi:hypothetical protein